MKLLSFICTVKNGARYLDECIQSVVEHYPGAEFVIVDDGSTDGTAAILERWAAAVPQIRVISTGGVGRGAALNMAVEACTRPYIANIDADDIALPGREALVQYLEEAEASVVLAAGSSKLLVEGKERRDENGEVLEQPNDPVIYEVTNKLHRGDPISHVGVVMRREAVLSVGGYDSNRRVHLDYDLWIRLVDRGMRLVVSNNNVSIKRLHAGQSFERRRHLRFVLTSIGCQYRAARSTSEYLVVTCISPARLGWGVLPTGLRNVLRPHMRSIKRFTERF